MQRIPLLGISRGQFGDHFFRTLLSSLFVAICANISLAICAEPALAFDAIVPAHFTAERLVGSLVRKYRRFFAARTCNSLPLGLYRFRLAIKAVVHLTVLAEPAFSLDTIVTTSFATKGRVKPFPQ